MILSKNGKMIAFRHPIKKGADGFGLQVQQGVARLDDDGKAKIVEDLKILLREKPKSADECPSGIGREAFGFYFGPLYENVWQRWHERDVKALEGTNRLMFQTVAPSQAVAVAPCAKCEALTIDNELLRKQVNTLIESVGELTARAAPGGIITQPGPAPRRMKLVPQLDMYGKPVIDRATGKPKMIEVEDKGPSAAPKTPVKAVVAPPKKPVSNFVDHKKALDKPMDQAADDAEFIDQFS